MSAPSPEPRIRYVEVDGLRLRTSVRGAGLPLLVLTGIGAALELSASVERALNAHGVQTIALDAPGTGESSRYARPRRMPGLARTVERTLEALGYDRVDVIGVSFGGILAQQLAHQSPDRVRRLVLAATAAGTPGLGGVPGSPRALLALATPARHQSPDHYRRVAGTLYGGEARRDPDAMQDGSVARFTKAPSRRGYHDQLYAISFWTGLPWLWRLRQPTLVLAGDDDPIVPVINGRILARIIPRARLEIIRGGGHLFLRERPAELADIIAPFLKAEDGAALGRPTDDARGTTLFGLAERLRRSVAQLSPIRPTSAAFAPPVPQVPYPHSNPYAGRRADVARTVRDVVFVDGVRTPFGKAGPKGIYAESRADDLVINCVRELLRRNPSLPPERIDDVAIAATTQIGDQGLTIGRTASLLAGLPKSVPGFAIDRMCAGAMTAVTTTAGGIAFGAYDVVIAGGVEHMGHHPMGEGIDPNPRMVADKVLDLSAMSMGSTAENLHDRFPALTKQRADAYAVRSQGKLAQAYADGKVQPRLVPVATRSAELGWGLATADEPPRPGTTMQDLAELKTPFRPHGRVTAGNAAGLNDGATACILAAEETAKELGLPVRMRLVSYAFAGVAPEVMGVGPVPATEKALAKAGLSIDDIGLFEINEAFAVQVLAFLDHFGIADDDPRVNPYGGAIALGHPLASSGVRLMTQLADEFGEHPQVRYGLTTMCVGLGMGGTVIWENPHWKGETRE